MPRMQPRRAPEKHQNATFSLYHDFVYEPNPRSDDCSNPFSDGFLKLSEKGRRGLQHSPTERSRDLSGSEIRPNSRSKRCSNPFSDSFLEPSEKPHLRAKRLTIRRLIAT
jgi:hypothetical protein